MKLKLLRNDDHAQVGGIVMLVLGIFISGFFYIIMGYMEGMIVTQNNDLISNPNVPYSQQHADAMSYLFTYWWALPVFFLICFIIYAIKNGLFRQIGESY